MRTPWSLALALVVLGSLSAASAGATTWSTAASCPFNGDPGDLVDRAFYVSAYPANNVGQVQLGFATDVSGGAVWRIQLTAHRGTFDGPVLGTATATVTVEDTGETLVTFDFGGAPVTPGDTLAFVVTPQQLSGTPGYLYFDYGSGTCPNIYETDDSSPPLSTIRRDSMGLKITAETTSTSCVPSDTVLCIDDVTGDNRFRASVTYSTIQGGGHAGSGQAVTLDPLGIHKGGLFWFFSPENPEILVKVLNGCSINSRFWVYLAADTNVGFTVTVRDTQTGQTFTYTNPDRTVPPNVQNVDALPCS